MTRTKHIFPSSAKHKTCRSRNYPTRSPKRSKQKWKKSGKRVVGVPAGADTAEGPNGVANNWSWPVLCSGGKSVVLWGTSISFFAHLSVCLSDDYYRQCWQCRHQQQEQKHLLGRRSASYRRSPSCTRPPSCTRSASCTRSPLSYSRPAPFSHNRTFWCPMHSVGFLEVLQCTVVLQYCAVVLHVL